jgi:hypothetical protein
MRGEGGRGEERRRKGRGESDCKKRELKRKPKNKVCFGGGQVLPLQILSTTQSFLCFLAAFNSTYSTVEQHVEVLSIVTII